MSTKNKMLAIIIPAMMIMTSCGGGNGNGVHACDNGTCVDQNESVQGNFTTGTTTETGVTEMPTVSVNTDTLTVTCAAEANTENGFAYFQCNNTGNATQIDTSCVHGVVYYEIVDTSTDQAVAAYSSGCASYNFYCDNDSNGGFISAEICNSSTNSLVIDSEDEAKSVDLDSQQ